MVSILVSAAKINVAMDTTKELFIELLKNVNERKMIAEELTRKRIIPEQKCDYLKEMKKRSRLEPVIGE